MATIQVFKSYDTSTLANFKSWAQSIGSALSSLGWVQAADTSPASQVNWGNVVDVPASNVVRTSTWSFDGNWSSGNSYTGGSDIVMYDPGTGAVCYQSVSNNHGTLGNVLRQSAHTLSLTSVDNTAGGHTVYHGTITGGDSNAYANWMFVISGCDNAANNGTFFCYASTATTLTLVNGIGIAETSGGSPTAVSSANTTVYQWSSVISGWSDADFIGESLIIAGYSLSGNNGTFTVVLSGSAAGGNYLAVTNASGATQTGAATIVSLTDPSTSSAKTSPLWTPYYYEIWQTNDSLTATSPIYLRLVYSTQNTAQNGIGASSTPRIFLSVGTRVVNGFLAGNVLNGGTSPFEIVITPGSSAGGSSTFECDFSGDSASFSMHMWRDRPSATWTFVIDRGKNNAGVNIDTYFSILSAQGNSRFQQQLFKQGAGVRCPNTIDAYWESIHSNSTSFAQNGLVPAFPVFPIVGYLGNPLIRAVTIGLNDGTGDGEQFSVSVYGSPHTYMVSQNSTVSEPGNLNPAILWE